MRLGHFSRRDVEPVKPAEPSTALVLSGGSINGIFLQLGFLQALRASGLWPHVGWVYGTSAGALSGWAAALDAVDEHERFLMEMQPADVFAAHDLWRTPFVGLHRYTLPETVTERLGDPVELARQLKAGPRELTVVTTDIGLSPSSAESDDPFERAFSSRVRGAGDVRRRPLRLGGDQHLRAADPDRRERLRRRRLGAQLPARLRLSRACGAADRRLPLPRLGLGLRGPRAQLAAQPHQPACPHQGRPRSRGRATRGDRAAGTRRADAPGRHDRPAQPHRRLPQQRPRGAARRRARPLAAGPARRARAHAHGDRLLHARRQAHGAPGRAGRGLRLGRTSRSRADASCHGSSSTSRHRTGSGSTCPAAACRGATRRSWRSSPTAAG